VTVRAAVVIEPDTPAVRLPRPIPPRAIRLRVVQLQKDATYRVNVTGIRGLTGVTGPSERQFRTPVEFVPDTAAAVPPAP
jgi:hypothetical protein